MILADDDAIRTKVTEVAVTRQQHFHVLELFKLKHENNFLNLKLYLWIFAKTFETTDYFVNCFIFFIGSVFGIFV